MAAAPQPAGAGMPPGPPVPVVVPSPAPPVGVLPSVPLLTFIEHYRDVRFDNKYDSYSCLLTNFDPMLGNTLLPQDLLGWVLQEDDKNSRAIVVHWHNTAVPEDPG
jgi:hypothetical protein